MWEVEGGIDGFRGGWVVILIDLLINVVIRISYLICLVFCELKDLIKRIFFSLRVFF